MLIGILTEPKKLTRGGRTNKQGGCNGRVPSGPSRLREISRSERRFCGRVGARLRAGRRARALAPEGPLRPAGPQALPADARPRRRRAGPLGPPALRAAREPTRRRLELGVICRDVGGWMTASLIT